MMQLPRLGVVGAIACAMVASACGSSADSHNNGGSGAVSIVASTNVYGDIAESIAGDDAQVTSIVADPNQDPHEYEATARDELAVSKADIVIANGGGFDHFMDRLIEANTSDPVTLDAVDISGLAPTEDHGDDEQEGHEHDDDDVHHHVDGFNEHVWYDYETIGKVAQQISAQLREQDPAHSDDYADRYREFDQELDSLKDDVAAVKKDHDGQDVAITEPVPLYLLEAAGLKNKTPDDFSEAIEEDTDVAPRVLDETLNLFTSDAVSVLAYNVQASNSMTERVRKAADHVDIPVVDFTETLPKGTSYTDWQHDNVARLAKALA